MTWTVERVDRLRQLFNEGWSYGEIGKALGVTRNAALGKAMRLGLRTPGATKALRSKAAKAPRRIASDGKMLRRGGMRSFERAAGFVDLPAEKSLSAVTLLNLKPTSCRWPISGDGRDIDAMLFCGAPQVDDDCSYCKAHKRRSIARREAA